MTEGNGRGEYPRAGHTLEEKVDILVDALVDIREQLELGAEKADALQEQLQSIEEKLDALGFPGGEGFSYDS